MDGIGGMGGLIFTKIKSLIIWCFRGFQEFLDFSQFIIYSLENKVDPSHPTSPLGQCPKFDLILILMASLSGNRWKGFVVVVDATHTAIPGDSLLINN